MRMEAAAEADRKERRLRLRVRGSVQGVGFRPFAYSLASRLSLSGFVRNDAEGVLIEVEGKSADAFVSGLELEAPPLARIDSIEVADLDPTGDHAFVIDATRAGRSATRIGADAAICEACLDELFDPRSRFYNYPLVNCTHCGPRYTLTRALPYDRAQTSMARFPMCAACAGDYSDPSNRRFHAEPIACPTCGPKLNVAAAEVAELLRAGGVAAVKGLGGFHLLCDARNEAAVARLRERKARDAKPFAVMVVNLVSAERLAEIGPAERA
ncbi:MAG TPA: acylphosphatase, partial [Roseiarcus sp.]|nr:acylphosphatase [Roseiarcus sp.]